MIEGEEGTDVDINGPKEDVTYNTYWGYQKITIDKASKVPFVNSEKNESYAQFTLFDKNGNVLYSSNLVKPGTHVEWDAYAHYNGKSGSYFHDLLVTFYSPVLNETGEVVDYQASMFAANTPDFEILIK